MEDVGHTLQTLATKVQHTAYRNRGVYLAMRAYLQQREGNYVEALGSLREAEAVLKQDHPTNFSRQALVTYGNYAWIYYHLANFETVELYLGRIHEICQSLSSPEPYSAHIPEIHAQKGWSLLAAGSQNGEEAKMCFQTALQGDKSNKDFQAGLVLSLFAAWTCSQKADHWKEAKRLVEIYHRRRPLNDEVKVHLASLLEKTDWQRTKRLAEEAVRSSLDPEVLRNAAKVCQQRAPSRAIDILQQAIALAPGYYLLHHDLGVCYANQLQEAAAPEEREETLTAAIESFKRAVEMDPRGLISRLALARMYSERAPLHAQEIFHNLVKELPSFSKRGQRVICLHWGDFLLHWKGLRREAAEVYRAGLALPGGGHKEWQQLRRKLEAVDMMCEEDSERDSEREH
ncbi:PREDICTED: interferon-induced protein with tetratricopeptide repeats 1-like [Gekko japonicus]|uniref:Interferon-induced protein with tetratricopeptide repeats 1-like n=1 Tax=Gekko japonicus TaxID=146911 RepID=A0ABM1L6D2_GEKJA|nr:PREDICTED: interferon-induced protein with tetratricopeptide repeats 1-like [Gekko japonicus]